MKLSEERIVRASPEVIWAALLDPEVLRLCVPGCESLEGTPEDGFEAVVVQKVGPVKAKFNGRVVLSNMVAPERLTISGEGKGGAAGFAKGGAHVTLAPEGEGTRLTYEVEANVGGKLAQLGSRIIDSFARKMADDFFNRFQAAVEPPAEEEEEDAAPEADGEGEGDPAPKKGWFRRLRGS